MRVAERFRYNPELAFQNSNRVLVCDGRTHLGEYTADSHTRRGLYGWLAYERGAYECNVASDYQPNTRRYISDVVTEGSCVLETGSRTIYKGFRPDGNADKDTRILKKYLAVIPTDENPAKKFRHTRFHTWYDRDHGVLVPYGASTYNAHRQGITYPAETCRPISKWAWLVGIPNKERLKEAREYYLEMCKLGEVTRRVANDKEIRLNAAGHQYYVPSTLSQFLQGVKRMNTSHGGYHTAHQMRDDMHALVLNAELARMYFGTGRSAEATIATVETECGVDWIRHDYLIKREY